MPASLRTWLVLPLIFDRLEQYIVKEANLCDRHLVSIHPSLRDARFA
jgi:hypothetical protein